MRHSQPPLLRLPGRSIPKAFGSHLLRGGLLVPRVFTEQFANNPQSTLVRDLLPDDSSFEVADGGNFSSSGKFATIVDGEIIGVGVRSGNWFSTLVRGDESTGRALHLAGATVTQILTARSYVQGIVDRLDANRWGSLIQEQLLAGDQQFVTFSSIPQTYRHLKLVINGRFTFVTTDGYLMMRFNGDAGANYDVEQHYGAGTVHSLAITYGLTAGRVIDMTGASASTATQIGAGEILIPHYSGSTFDKAWSSVMTSKWNTSGNSITSGTFGGQWRSQAPITQIDFLLDPAAGVGNLKAGSLFSLYGMR